MAVIGLGAVRLKLVAVSEGPSGVGTLGIGLAAASTLATLLGLGLSTSGISAVASSRHQHGQRQAVLTALNTAAWILAIFGGIVAGALWIAVAPEGGDRLGLAFALALAVSSSISIVRWSAGLNGEQQFRRLAGAQLSAAVIATAAVAATIPLAPELTVGAALALPPLTLLVTMRLASGPQPRPGQSQSLGDRWATLRPLLMTGMAASSGTLLMSGSQMLASFWVVHKLGGEANGYFQACWMLASIYPTFLLAAMTADYFPRISGLQPRSPEMRQAIDFQMRISFGLTLTLALALGALAPVVLTVLYSRDFQTAAELLRWFLVGEVFKAVAWPLSFVLLAQHERRSYIASEATWTIVYLGALVVLTPLGSKGLGIAYALANAVFCTQLVIRTNFRPSGRILAGTLLGTLALGVSAASVGQTATHISVFGIVLAAGLAFWTVRSMLKEKRATEI